MLRKDWDFICLLQLFFLDWASVKVEILLVYYLNSNLFYTSKVIFYKSLLIYNIDGGV